MTDYLTKLPDEEGTTIKPFAQGTLADAEDVVRSAFGESDIQILRKILLNPVSELVPKIEYGDVIYSNSRPVGFEALVLRRLYIGKRQLWGVAASTMGIKPETSPLVLLSLMKRNIAPRTGSVIWFANTANDVSVKLNRKLGIKGRGPETWELNRYAIIHTFAFVWSIVCRKVLKRHCASETIRFPRVAEERVARYGRIDVRRMTHFDVQAFDTFWSEYLKNNKGLVSSRSARELDWMFGENVTNGGDVLLAAWRDAKIIGYIVIRSGTNGWWRIVDMIASENDADILDVMLKSAKKFLRKRTRAAILMSRGFPIFASDTIGRQLPRIRMIGANSFLWHFTDAQLAKENADIASSRHGWFFGPYDGDACL